jgi:stage IV sporulation protein FB
MGWSFRIARIAGIDVRIHVTFLLLLAYFGYQGYAHDHSAAGAVASLVRVLSLFLCVLLHEFGHALAAARYGIKTPDITLLPIGGVARLQRMPDKPGQELVVAIAGPLVNVVIAAAIFLGFRVRAGLGLQQIDNPTTGLLEWLLLVNVVLVVFNLIPAFPMDGGRVLRALLAMRLSYSQATRIAARVGQVLALGFCLLALMGGGWMLLLIAIFVYFGAGQEAAAAQMRDLARGVAVSEAMVTDFRTLTVHDTLENAVEALLRTSQHEFPVLDPSGNVVGLLTRNDMIHALRLHGPQVPVTAVMRRDVQSVALGSSFDQAFRTMAESQTPAVLVRDWNGKLVGVVTPENVGEMMMVHEAMDQAGRRPGAWGFPGANVEPGGLAPPPVPLPENGKTP